MVVDCVFLIFLVLLQLPKKEAGAGLAFGGAATDALFGAGSGNVLTKVTKYAATVFFALAVIVSLMQSKYHYRTTSNLQRRLEQSSQPASIPSMPASPAAPAAPSTPASSASPTAPAAQAAAPTLPTTSGNLPAAPAAEATNVPVPPK